MKTIYKINKFILIINGLLFLTIYFGFLFLIITGAVQVLCYLFYLNKWDDIKPELKGYLKFYPAAVLLTLFSIVVPKYIDQTEVLYAIALISSITLGILFFLLSKKQMKYTLELQNK